ncbi:MAG: TauD/TfdA family dioxygenase, partial [Pseudomonadota bacterium]
MSAIRTTELVGPSVWDGATIRADDAWIHHLAEDEIAEIDAALRGLGSSGKAFPQFERADFPLPRLGPKLDAVAAELEDGRGFVLLRGVPITRYSEAE